MRDIPKKLSCFLSCVWDAIYAIVKLLEQTQVDDQMGTDKRIFRYSGTISCNGFLRTSQRLFRTGVIDGYQIRVEPLAYILKHFLNRKFSSSNNLLKVALPGRSFSYDVTSRQVSRK